MTQTQPSPLTCSRHELTWCTAPSCPGAAVKRKLEAFEDLLAALLALADAAEAAIGSELEMPSHNSTMDDFDVALEQARGAIAKAR